MVGKVLHTNFGANGDGQKAKDFAATEHELSGIALSLPFPVTFRFDMEDNDVAQVRQTLFEAVRANLPEALLKFQQAYKFRAEPVPVAEGVGLVNPTDVSVQLSDIITERHKRRITSILNAKSRTMQRALLVTSLLDNFIRIHAAPRANLVSDVPGANPISPTVVALTDTGAIVSAADGPSSLAAIKSRIRKAIRVHPLLLAAHEETGEDIKIAYDSQFTARTQSPGDLVRVIASAIHWSTQPAIVNQVETLLDDLNTASDRQLKTDVLTQGLYKLGEKFLEEGYIRDTLANYESKKDDILEVMSARAIPADDEAIVSVGDAEAIRQYIPDIALGTLPTVCPFGLITTEIPPHLESQIPPIVDEGTRVYITLGVGRAKVTPGRSVQDIIPVTHPAWLVPETFNGEKFVGELKVTPKAHLVGKRKGGAPLVQNLFVQKVESGSKPDAYDRRVSAAGIYEAVAGEGSYLKAGHRAIAYVDAKLIDKIGDDLRAVINEQKKPGQTLSSNVQGFAMVERLLPALAHLGLLDYVDNRALSAFIQEPGYATSLLQDLRAIGWNKFVHGQPVDYKAINHNNSSVFVTTLADVQNNSNLTSQHAVVVATNGTEGLVVFEGQRLPLRIPVEIPDVSLDSSEAHNLIKKAFRQGHEAGLPLGQSARIASISAGESLRSRGGRSDAALRPIVEERVPTTVAQLLYYRQLQTEIAPGIETRSTQMRRRPLPKGHSPYNNWLRQPRQVARPQLG
jgi:hypothetical protein